MHPYLRSLLSASAAVCLITQPASAKTEVPNVFGSNMVLQQKQQNKVWGWDDAGTEITVSIAGQSKKAKVGEDGNWHVMLDPMEVGGPHQLKVAGHDKLVFDNVMIGEVWICSGQSNMQWAVKSSNDGDLAALTAHYPNIRLLSVPQVGTDEPQNNFKGSWTTCTPETAPDFSAVGYYFGRQLHESLGVPIGLIDNAWGGSACEAWINRKVIDQDKRFKELMEHWQGVEKHVKSGQADKDYEKSLAAWKVKADEAKKNGKPAPRKPRNSKGNMTGNQRPANIYNGVLHPTIGYGIKGAIWYQGESNASRAYQYRDLFPLMIKNWRDEFKQGDFPFYWVQLADFRAEKDDPAESDWAELREAQTMTMSTLPNTGEAVIIDIGEANDIHPTNKLDVGKRLARWALAKDYGIKGLAYRSPLYKSMEKKDGHILAHFDHVGRGLDTVDVSAPLGFTIAGADKVFHHAQAEILGKGADRNQVKVWNDKVKNPVAVRYAWADNPVCNVRNFDGLPLTPFRTDDWPGVTANKKSR